MRYKVPLLAAGLAAALGTGASATPCAQNRELDSVAYRLQFTPDNGTPLEYRFRFAACRAEDRDHHGDPITPQAVRTYLDARTGYGLVLTTPSGAGRSGVSLVQVLDPNGGSLVAGAFGDRQNSRLASGALDLGPVTIADYRGSAKVSHGTAVLRAER